MSNDTAAGKPGPLSASNRRHRLLVLLPGVLLALLVGAAGRFATAYVPYVGAVTLAILFGIVVGNLVRRGPRFDAGIKLVEKRFLEVAIVLLGLNLQFAVLAQLEWRVLLFLVVLVVATILVGRLLGRALGLSGPFGWLLGVGMAICGSSAIAATAPLVQADEQEVGLSTSAVNLVGVIGIFLLPAMVLGLELSDRAGAVLIGGMLPAVGHVVAAGFSVNEAVGGTATVIKMFRVLLLGPMMLVIAAMTRRNRSTLDGGQAVSTFPIPMFIVGFFLMSALSSLGMVPEPLEGPLSELGKWLLIIAMAAIGLKIKLASLLRQGPMALLVALLITVFQLVALAGFVLLLAESWA